MPVGSLVYSLTMRSLVSWGHLFPTIKGKTADFRPLLPSETCQSDPFSSLPRLGDVIEEQFQGQSGLPDPQVKPWLVALGSGLRRVVLEDAELTGRVRELASRLAQTEWQVAGGMESVPYIDRKAAGTSRPIDVYWRANTLYVQMVHPPKWPKQFHRKSPGHSIGQKSPRPSSSAMNALRNSLMNTWKIPST